jgi:UDP-glucose 4-epimerase
MAQPTMLLTGGTGFFGKILKHRVLGLGYSCVSTDLVRADDVHEQLTSVQGDLRDSSLVHDLFRRYAFDGVLHYAAIQTGDGEVVGESSNTIG